MRYLVILCNVHRVNIFTKTSFVSIMFIEYSDSVVPKETMQFLNEQYQYYNLEFCKYSYLFDISKVPLKIVQMLLYCAIFIPWILSANEFFLHGVLSRPYIKPYKFKGTILRFSILQYSYLFIISNEPLTIDHALTMCKAKC